MYSAIMPSVRIAPTNQPDLEAILDDPRATVEYRITRAARRLLATHGLEVSMDDIATEAQVGRRTVFRYFSSRDELIARALSDSLNIFNNQVDQSLQGETDLQQWLFRVVESLHVSQLRAGRGIWQLAATDDKDLPVPIAKVNRQRRQSRRILTQAISQEAWKRSGESGEAPRDIELAFALAISSFAVHSLHGDYSAKQDETVQAISAMLYALLKGATK